MSTVFKSASQQSTPITVSEKVVPKNPDRPTSDSTASVPIALYEEINGEPYSLTYFGVSKTPSAEIEGMSKYASKIDGLYRDMVEGGMLTDSPESYKNVVEKAIKATESKFLPSAVRMQRVFEFLKLMHNRNIYEQAD